MLYSFETHTHIPYTREYFHETIPQTCFTQIIFLYLTWPDAISKISISISPLTIKRIAKFEPFHFWQGDDVKNQLAVVVY